MLRFVGSKLCCLAFALAFVSMGNTGCKPFRCAASGTALQRIFISNTSDGRAWYWKMLRHGLTAGSTRQCKSQDAIRLWTGLLTPT